MGAHKKSQSVERTDDDSGSVLQQLLQLIARQHHRHSPRALGTQSVDPFERDIEHFLVQEQNRPECLILRTGRNVTIDGVLPNCAPVLYPVAVVSARLLKLVGGCFLFCTREAFDTVGGFNERYFAAEEAAFIRAIKGRGRFAVPGPTVLTSGRKVRAYSGWRIVREAWRWMVAGPESYQRREGLDIWYGERAADRVADTASGTSSGGER